MESRAAHSHGLILTFLGYLRRAAACLRTLKQPCGEGHVGEKLRSLANSSKVSRKRLGSLGPALGVIVSQLTFGCGYS